MAEILSSTGALVLVVDDDQMSRLIARSALTPAGFEVVEAADGLEALQAYERRQGEVALIVLDLVMPNLDGYETLRRLRSEAPDLPVIIVSGVPTRDAVIAIGRQKHLSFLKKPIVPDVLRQQVIEMISTSRGARSG